MKKVLLVVSIFIALIVVSVLVMSICGGKPYQNLTNYSEAEFYIEPVLKEWDATKALADKKGIEMPFKRKDILQIYVPTDTALRDDRISKTYIAGLQKVALPNKWKEPLYKPVSVRDYNFEEVTFGTGTYSVLLSEFREKHDLKLER